MKRWPQLLAVVALLIITGTLATLYVVERRARREEVAHDERAARYDAIVTKYYVDLKPGLTRKEIKDFLRVRGGEFFDSCCSEKRGVFATLTKIGDEPNPGSAAQ